MVVGWLLGGVSLGLLAPTLIDAIFGSNSSSGGGKSGIDPNLMMMMMMMSGGNMGMGSMGLMLLAMNPEILSSLVGAFLPTE
jgi:hypothetical protein